MNLPLRWVLLVTAGATLASPYRTLAHRITTET